ncbi:MAG: PD-(D/E)XK motif protein [Oscillospiraceae bacterium]|nr:PD-(D/E)XK motif protein [Oscillospiraceae bacterium]
MSFTTDIYKKILDDISQRKDFPGSHASRLITYKGGNHIVFSINVISGLREAFIALDELPDHIDFPKWHGIAIDVVQLPAYGDKHYIRFVQLPQSADHIFEIVIEDLRVSVEALGCMEATLSTVYAILLKWKRFFQAERDPLMSDELQEGLYGELLFLAWAITNTGTSAVSCWTGGARETHDFYFATHAVEVKTTSKKEPYYATISSEYQLDNSDIPGRLFLCFYALRKSSSSGERLPEIVQRIRDMLVDDPSAKMLFDDKLIQYGYFDAAAEMYTTGFHRREQYCFEITELTPRIIRSMYKPGVAKVAYELSIAQCLPCAIAIENLSQAITRGCDQIC